MAAHLRANLILVVSTVLLCSVAYPLVVYGVGHFVFPSKAEGSIVRDADGNAVGSRLIAQEFKGDEFFQPRPSAVSYNASGSGGSNLGANNPKLRDRVARQLGKVAKYIDGRPVGDEVEAWFHKNPNILADWAERYPTPADAWLGADDATKEAVGKWQEANADDLDAWKAKWKADHDDKDAPDALAFFTVFARKNPGTVPGIDDKTKTITPASGGPDVRGWFFDMWLQAHPNDAARIAQVPADMVTTSGSGLDPHITRRNAMYQLDRVVNAWAEKKKITSEAERNDLRLKIVTLIDSPDCTERVLGGLGGEPLVNVLELNRALAARMGAMK
jgi:K+-transporting ATPase ATPase C chain